MLAFGVLFINKNLQFLFEKIGINPKTQPNTNIVESKVPRDPTRQLLGRNGAAADTLRVEDIQTNYVGDLVCKNCIFIFGKKRIKNIVNK